MISLWRTQPGCPASPYQSPLLLGLLIACIAAGCASAADVDGYWTLKSKVGAKPVLVKDAAAKLNGLKLKGGIDVESVRWCVPQGLPYSMMDAGALEIVRAPNETVIIPQHNALYRHIYTAGQTHPSDDTFDNTPVGNSIGKWNGNELTAETVNMSAGVGPASAARTEKAKLVERFSFAPDNKHFMVVSTWTDPTVFRKPYTYTLTYERLPEGFKMPEFYCDPRANGVGHK
jgi:hypothetical protein